MKVAVVGVTGLVGKIMIERLEQRNFNVSGLIPIASERSQGEYVSFKNKKFPVVGIEDGLSLKPELALFSAGADIAKDWVPKFKKSNCVVIDNSAAWRMDKNVPLIVPEINADVLTKDDKIIANPNCSTIQMVMALAPLHQKYKIARLIISTYQSVSGSGYKGAAQLADERQGKKNSDAYPFPIFMNVIPQCDDFEDNGYTKEEMKLVDETRKILRTDKLRITATAVRVPVLIGHSESVNVEFENDYDLEDVIKVLKETEGIQVMNNGVHPMPLLVKESDKVCVGRIRRDESNPNSLNLWIVADNLRKGAATNTIQIAEYLVQKGWIGAGSKD
ncbi:MAG: aspartate-semialdehyde dehydrogenase [Bacteroidetes bacterium]|nr:aspartate-semialdehyde dehydrogenase [Bacteroidota bacterium]